MHRIFPMYKHVDLGGSFIQLSLRETETTGKILLSGRAYRGSIALREDSVASSNVWAIFYSTVGRCTKKSTILNLLMLVSCYSSFSIFSLTKKQQGVNESPFFHCTQMAGSLHLYSVTFPVKFQELRLLDHRAPLYLPKSK